MTVLACCWSALAMAQPLAQPGDRGLRQQLQWLVDRDCLSAPVMAWPLDWADVRLRERPDCDGAAARAVRERRARALASGTRAGLRLAGANQVPLIRDFGDTTREQGEAAATLGWQNRRFAVHLEATAVDDPLDGDEARADGSHASVRLGNWRLGAGAVDRWWGPGWHSSLLWSNNARPVPGIWLNRRRSEAFGTPWLSWLGPWSLRLFAGRLESERFIPHAKLLGARLGFRPVPSLELGLSRMAQWGGDGRPEDWDSFVDMLAGHDNVGSEGIDRGEDPSNQRAGFDIRWGVPVGGHTLALYGQFIGEDEAGYAPSKYVSLAGMDWQFPHPWGGGLLYLEATETTAGSLSRDLHYNTAFEHGTYRTGWRYEQRPLASVWGTDARVAALGARTLGTDGSALEVTLSRASFNRDGRLLGFPGAGAAFEPVRNRTLWLASAEYERPLAGGTLNLGVAWSEAPLPAAPERERATGRILWERNWSL